MNGLFSTQYQMVAGTDPQQYIAPFTPLTDGNLPWHILFGFESSMVTTTLVAGNVLMKDRHLLTLDEAAIAEEALALAPDVWERYKENVKTVLANP